MAGLIQQKLPVYFHIPKCAGTYVYNTSICMLREYVSPTYVIIVTRGDEILYRFGATIKNTLNEEKYKQENRFRYSVDINDLDINDLNLLFVEVCARSFHDYKNSIYNKLPEDVIPYEFIILREPYSLATSLYNYLSSDKSAHELSHADFKFKAFEDYINSTKLEGSWLPRKFFNIVNTELVTEEHVNKTCSILDNMLVADIPDTTSTIFKVFEHCYGLTDKNAIGKLSLNDINRNETKNKQLIPYSSLREDTKWHFNNHTRWDRFIFKKYTKI
jgi:hypothetical protein